MQYPKILALSAAALLAATSLCSAQTAVVSTSTTTSDGTISEFSPDTIVIRSESSPEPVRYTYSKTTTYVDDEGAPVSMEIVKSGLPVTVHYVREGERTVANRVIVHRKKSVHVEPAASVEKRTVTTIPAPAPAPLVEEKTSTTTTTTNSK